MPIVGRRVEPLRDGLFLLGGVGRVDPVVQLRADRGIQAPFGLAGTVAPERGLELGQPLPVLRLQRLLACLLHGVAQGDLCRGEIRGSPTPPPATSIRLVTRFGLVTVKFRAIDAEREVPSRWVDSTSEVVERLLQVTVVRELDVLALGRAIAARVVADDAVALGEGGDVRIPLPEVRHAGMEQHEGWPLARLFVVQPAAVDRDESALLHAPILPLDCETDARDQPRPPRRARPDDPEPGLPRGRGPVLSPVAVDRLRGACPDRVVRDARRADAQHRAAG